MSLFTSCDKGHDLTAPGAYIYRQGGTRVCRECAKGETTKRRTRGAF